MRLSDADESAVNLAGSGLSGLKKRAFDRYTALRKVDGGCLAILGWEGPKDVVTARRGPRAQGVPPVRWRGFGQ